MTITKEATYLTDTTVYDPETNETVRLEVWKDPSTGNIFAVDSDFLEASSTYMSPMEIISPYRKDVVLRLRAI